jgi:hypothetical protein
VIVDNHNQRARTKPNGGCLKGFVWREATPNDHVCVVPLTRTQTQAVNRGGSVQVQQPAISSRGHPTCPSPQELRDGKCIVVHVPEVISVPRGRGARSTGPRYPYRSRIIR